MNKKKMFFISLLLSLTITFIFSSLVFAQVMRFWDNCKVSAYGYNFAEMETGEIRSISFNVGTPPTGSDIPNTLEVTDYVTGENHSITLSIDDPIIIRYDSYPPITNTATPGEDSSHYIINFEGAVVNVTIRGDVVPEFPPILIVPLFIISTLIVLIFRRKP